MLQIYHNPRCGKSRACVALFQNATSNFEIIDYLKNPPSVAMLQSILNKSDLPVMDFIRINEKLWKEKFKNKEFTTEELLNIICQNPVLLQRPIVVSLNNAFIARQDGDWQALLI